MTAEKNISLVEGASQGIGPRKPPVAEQRSQPTNSRQRSVRTYPEGARQPINQRRPPQR